MKEPLVDRLARILASDTGVDPQPLTRRDVVVRGTLGALAVTTAGRLAFPQTAGASETGCKSLRVCLDRANAESNAVWQSCLTRYPATTEDFSLLGCTLWEWRPHAQKGHRDCLAKCPPPRKPKKQPRKPPRPGDPPPLPPNPYDGIANECANCSSVGGWCCWGGPDPEHLCACANPTVGCLPYGCG